MKPLVASAIACGLLVVPAAAFAQPVEDAPAAEPPSPPEPPTPPVVPPESPVVPPVSPVPTVGRTISAELELRTGGSMRSTAEEFLVLPDGAELGGRLRTITADGGLGTGALKLTDVQIILGISRRIDLKKESRRSRGITDPIMML